MNKNAGEVRIIPPTSKARAAWRDQFQLDPAIAYLNHGSFGAVPKVVRAIEDQWRTRLERNPTRFLAQDLPPLLRERAALIAARFGGRPDDWAFVENASQGVCAVLFSLPLAPGDDIVTTSHVYNAVRQGLRHLCPARGVINREIDLPMPLDDPDQVVSAIAAAIGPRTRLVVIDHIASASATVMPVAAVAALCRARGVPVLVDGAHGPGQVALDVPALGVDWYVGNLHKWHFAARGTAVLWCAAGRQADLHPTVISHGFGQGFAREFDWTGTRDPSAWLAATEAFAVHDRFGGADLMAENRARAAAWGDRLCERWGSVAAAPAAMRAAMASVRLPARFDGDGARALRLRRTLSDRFGIEVPVWSIAGRLWLRVSAQCYVPDDDVDRLLDAVDFIGREGCA